MLECIFLLFNKQSMFKNSSNYMMIILMTLSGVSLFAFVYKNNLQIKNNINQFCQIINNNQNKLIKRKSLKEKKLFF